MVQSVSKLKELLFDQEQRELLHLSERIDNLFKRTGTQDRLRTSVADILSGALREAEVNKHEELSQAVAPIIVKTIKTEITNSKDEMVEALYPITGRLVSAYVSNAFTDMMAQVNQRLDRLVPGQALLLKMRAMMTGRSVAELALAQTQSLEVEELFVIRRSTGEVLCHWADSAVAAGPEAKSNRDAIIGGVLAAISDLTEEAFSAEKASLRKITTEGSTIYLRASPAYMLVAKCAGSAQRAIEQALDEEFLRFIEAHGAVLADASGHANGAGAQAQGELHRALPPFAVTLRSRISTLERKRGGGLGSLKWLLALIVIPLAGWLGYQGWISWQTETTRSAVRQVISEKSEFRGYPTQLLVQPGGRSLTVLGLAPTQALKSQLLADMHQAVPDVRIRDELTVVRAQAPDLVGLRRDLTQTLEARTLYASVRRLLTHTQEQLDTLLARLGSSSINTADHAGLSKIQTAVGQVRAKLKAVRGRLDRDASDPQPGLASAKNALPPLLRKLWSTETLLSALLGASGKPVQSATPRRKVPTGLDELAIELAVAAQRVSTFTSIAQQRITLSPIQTSLATLDKRLTALSNRPVPKPRVPTARERLVSWTRNHAVFFADGTAYKSKALAAKTLDQLANLMRGNNHLVRIVGYTDERGATKSNEPLAQKRAEVVRQALIDRGIASKRVVAVGRATIVLLSRQIGSSSPNRRVEFEIGFVGEGATANGR